MFKRTCLLFACLMMVGTLSTIPTVGAQTCGAGQWAGQFFNNVHLVGNPVATACTGTVNFTWGAGSPATGVNIDNFSARWTSTQTFPAAGIYLFTIVVEDGARLYFNETPLINEMTETNAPRTLTALYNVTTAGQSALLTLEMANFTGNAQISLNWVMQNTAYTPQPNIPVAPGGGNHLWTMEYFNTIPPSGTPVAIQNAPADGINRNYGELAPATNINPDNWSARWTRLVSFPQGSYTFYLRADDGARVMIDGSTIITQESFSQGTTHSATVALSAGQHIITVEHWDTGINADLFLTWDPPVGTNLLPNGCNGSTAGVNGSAELCPERPMARISTPVSTLNVRSGTISMFAQPNNTSPVLATLTGSNAYVAYGRNQSSTWLQVSTNNIDGWVPASAVVALRPIAELPITTFEQPPVVTQPQQPAPTPQIPLVRARALGNMRLRSGPGSSFDRVGGIGWGTEVNVVGRSSNGRWIEIVVPSENNLRGWSSREWYEILEGDLRALPVTGENGTASTSTTTTTTNTAPPTNATPFIPVANAAACSPTSWFFRFDADEQAYANACHNTFLSLNATGQNFEGGRVLVYENLPGKGTGGAYTVFVIYNDNTWELFSVPGSPNFVPPNAAAPAGRYTPTGTIGQLWQDYTHVRNKLGWAYAPANNFTGRFQEPLATVNYFYLDHGFNNLVLRLTAIPGGVNTWDVAGRY